MVKKRFFIGFNGIFLVLFLDICLLISIRTVDHHGRFESITDKWQTLLYVLGVYVSLLLFEMILFLIMRHRKISRLLDSWTSHIRTCFFVAIYGDIYVTIFLIREIL